ncbi:hypothetical protein [Prosthecobacter sp.]|uniref:hypothetical protein n=1 Tax=Prosthecobacter sp. TaxID=1965333 RepID=UPI0037841222
MTWSIFSLLRRCVGPCVLLLGLAGCQVEPQSFWTDVPKGETSLTEVAGPKVQERTPGHEAGLNVTYLRGYIRTPYTHPPRLVDVRGMQPGMLVVCPFTGKLFNIPLDFVDAAPRSRPVVRLQPLRQVPERAPAPVASAAAVSEMLPAAPVAKAVAPRGVELPYGMAVPGRPGFVYSPYSDKTHLVDVTGIAPGMEVKCPYSGKVFRVPVK